MSSTLQLQQIKLIWQNSKEEAEKQYCDSVQI